MIFISTPFSREAANRLNNLSVPAFKVGSGSVTIIPYWSIFANLKSL